MKNDLKLKKIMKEKIQTPFSMDDKDIISFQYDVEGNLRVDLAEYGDKNPLMTFVFEELLAIKYQVPDAGVQNFVVEVGSSEFLVNTLNYSYWNETVPRESVKLFQFLEIDNNPIVEVIAKRVKFINHFPNDPLSRIK